MSPVPSIYRAAETVRCPRCGRGMGLVAQGTRVLVRTATPDLVAPGSILVTCPDKGGRDKPRCRCPVLLTVEQVAA